VITESYTVGTKARLDPNRTEHCSDPCLWLVWVRCWWVVYQSCDTHARCLVESIDLATPLLSTPSEWPKHLVAFLADEMRRSTCLNNALRMRRSALTSGGIGVKADRLQPIISWRVRTARGPPTSWMLPYQNTRHCMIQVGQLSHQPFSFSEN